MFATRLQKKDGTSDDQGMVDSKYRIADHGYGKDNVKILRVAREGPVHSIYELEVCTHLKLYSVKDYVNGDNSDIVATDSQKNTVYLLAKKYGIKSPEEFALLLSSHFITKYRHVKEVHIHIEEYPWERLCERDQLDGYQKQKHNHAFIFTPVALRYCDVIQKRNDMKPVINSGLKNLRVLKTTKSSFVNFLSDEFRSLPDQYDRIFSTVVDSKWEYSTIEDVNFFKAWYLVKEIILKNFAGDPNVGIASSSVQNTLYLAEKEILDKIPQISSVSMQMPNKHYFNFDTSKFQSVVPGENDEVFVPIDKPSGIIYAQLDRRDIQSRL